MIGEFVEGFHVEHLLQELIVHRFADPHVDRLATVHYVHAVTIDVLRGKVEPGRNAYFGLGRVDDFFLQIKKQFN